MTVLNNNVCKEQRIGPWADTVVEGGEGVAGLHLFGLYMSWWSGGFYYMFDGSHLRVYEFPLAPGRTVWKRVGGSESWRQVISETTTVASEGRDSNLAKVSLWAAYPLFALFTLPVILLVLTLNQPKLLHLRSDPKWGEPVPDVMTHWYVCPLLPASCQPWVGLSVLS